MLSADKQRTLKQSASSHQSCRYISSHNTLEHQVQCLATKMSKLSCTAGKTIHPSRVLEDANSVKLRPKMWNKTCCLVSRMSAVTISQTVRQQQLKQRPASAGDVISTSQSALNNKRNSAQLTTGKNYKQLMVNNQSKQLTVNNELTPTVTQLLHPDWRKIPWIDYFGWTDDHADLCKKLQCEVRRGNLECIYYKSAKEHCAAGMTWRYHHSDVPFLGGPVVSTVSEALEMIRRVHSRDVRSGHVTDAVGPGYDGDDEQDV